MSEALKMVLLLAINSSDAQPMTVDHLSCICYGFGAGEAAREQALADLVSAGLIREVHGLRNGVLATAYARIEDGESHG